MKERKPNGVKITSKATGGIVMSAPKIAALLGAAGFFGVVVVAIILGKFAWADYLLYAAFVCLGLAAVIMILHFFIVLWKDFTGSKRRTPLDKLFNERETIHPVGPNNTLQVYANWSAVTSTGHSAKTYRTRLTRRM
jgi:uncharacterized membrane protein YuzA (DUF378 family)